MNDAPLELAEYESKEIIASRSVIDDIVQLAGGRVVVAPAVGADRWRVTATQHVGAIVTRDLEILIRPKVRIENLFAMLGVGIPAQAWQRQQFAFASSRDLLAALSQVFSRMVHQAIEAGLLRSYRLERERLVALRGRVDLAAQLRRPDLISTLACAFDEYTADIVENRLLKSATRRLLRVPGVPMLTRRTLATTASRFEDVGVADEAPRPDAVDRIVFNRLNRHYEPALRIAQLVLRNLTLLDRVGSNDASAFLVDMNDLFQRFVTDRLRRALRGRLQVFSEPDIRLGTKREVAMAPDLVFYRHDECGFVGDTKYKLSETGAGRSGDYYQMLAYTTALDLPTGVLIYCQSSGEAPSKEVIVRHAAKGLLTYPLDLSGPTTVLEKSLVTLADWINRAAARRTLT